MIIYNGMFAETPLAHTPPLAHMALPLVAEAFFGGADLGRLTPEILDQIQNLKGSLYKSARSGPGPSVLLDATQRFLELISSNEDSVLPGNFPVHLPLEIEMATIGYPDLFIPDQEEILLTVPAEIPPIEDLIQQEQNFNRFYGKTRLFVRWEGHWDEIRTAVPVPQREEDDEFLVSMYNDGADMDAVGALGHDGKPILRQILPRDVNNRFCIRIEIPDYTIPMNSLQMRALVTVALIEQVAHAHALIHLIDDFCNRTPPGTHLLAFLAQNRALDNHVPAVTYLSATARKMILYDDHLNFVAGEPDGFPNFITDFSERIVAGYPADNTLRPLILAEIDSMRNRHITFIKRYIRRGIQEDRFRDLARMVARDGCLYRIDGV